MIDYQNIVGSSSDDLLALIGEATGAKGDTKAVGGQLFDQLVNRLDADPELRVPTADRFSDGSAAFPDVPTLVRDALCKAYSFTKENPIQSSAISTAAGSIIDALCGFPFVGGLSAFGTQALLILYGRERCEKPPAS